MPQMKPFGNVFAPRETIPDRRTVDRISGCLFELSDQGKPTAVHVHFEIDGKPAELSIEFLNAMFLLTALRAVQLETGVKLPDDPRAPSARQGST